MRDILFFINCNHNYAKIICRNTISAVFQAELQIQFNRNRIEYSAQPGEGLASTQASCLEKLVEYTSLSYEFMTRQNAMASLKKLDYFNQAALENILDAAFNPNNRLATPAIETLKYFYAKNQYRKMIADYLSSKEWNEWQTAIASQVQ